MSNRKIQVLSYMEKNNGITSLEAINKLGNTRLSGTIYDLRKEGFEFATEWKKVNNRFGESVRVKKYYLISEPKERKLK